MNNKILEISIEFPPTCGGAGRVAYDTIKYLISKNINVDVVTMSGAMPIKEANFIFCRYVPVIFPFIIAKKIEKINLKDYDAIILNDVGSALIAALFFEDSCKRKSVIFLHGTEEEFVINNPKNIFKIVRFTSRYIKLLNNCKKIVCVSRYMKKRMQTYVADKEKMIVVHNGADENVFYRDSSKTFLLKKKLGIDSNSEVIVSASRILQEKGYDDMFQIVSKLLNEDHRDFHWIIAGEGEFSEALERKIIENKLSERIHLIGNQSPDGLRMIYNAADVFMLLSKFKEAYGLVYIEALMCGTPVIGNNLGGVDEVIKNKKNGFLVHSPNECYQIIKNGYYKQITYDMIENCFDDYKQEKENFLMSLF